MKAFLRIVAFSLQTDGSNRPVLTKGKKSALKSNKFQALLGKRKFQPNDYTMLKSLK